MGKHLINKDDSNLISILLLNKTINKRATIVFRQHFLNFEMQQHMNELILNFNNQEETSHLSKIDQTFQKHYLALNPNFSNILSQSESDQSSTLIMIALRNFHTSLLNLILFHPRTNFALHPKLNVEQVSFYYYYYYVFPLIFLLHVSLFSLFS